MFNSRELHNLLAALGTADFHAMSDNDYAAFAGAEGDALICDTPTAELNDTLTTLAMCHATYGWQCIISGTTFEAHGVDPAGDCLCVRFEIGVGV